MGPGDLFFNHMGYTEHASWIMCTNGQVARLHATLTGARACFAGSDFFEFVHQTDTALHETGHTVKFLMGDINKDGQPDLGAIKRSDTSKNSTEVHVLSGASRYMDCILHSGTALHRTDGTFEFAVADGTCDWKAELGRIQETEYGNQEHRGPYHGWVIESEWLR